MICDHSGKSEVIEVRKTKEGTRRRKVCIDCGKRFTTLETIVESRKPVSIIAKTKFALDGWLR